MYLKKDSFEFVCLYCQFLTRYYIVWSYFQNLCLHISGSFCKLFLFFCFHLYLLYSDFLFSFTFFYTTIWTKDYITYLKQLPLVCWYALCLYSSQSSFWLEFFCPKYCQFLLMFSPCYFFIYKYFVVSKQNCFKNTTLLCL